MYSPKNEEINRALYYRNSQNSNMIGYDFEPIIIANDSDILSS
jgi:hypothetical protein